MIISLFFLASQFLLSDIALATPDCTQEKTGLTRFLGKEFHPLWVETTANDGKPLLVEMSTKGEKLYFTFNKTNEGIWAEGLVSVCKEKKDLVVKISKKDIKIGPKAPRVLRWSMGSGAKFKLRLKDERNLHVSTFGWSGDFIRK